VLRRCTLEVEAVPAIFLHNCVAVVSALLIAFALRIRWLVALISFGIAMASSLAWKSIGFEWEIAWKNYLYRPVIEGELWHGSATETEVAGVIIFWLLPLALAYVTALARIAKIKERREV
jgi:hypothetical protein